MSVNILFDSLLEQSEEITGYLLKGYNSAARPLSFSDVVGPINKLGFIIFGTTIALPDISALIYNDVFISHYSTCKILWKRTHQCSDRSYAFCYILNKFQQLQC